MTAELPSPRSLDPDETVSPSVVVLPAVSFDPPLDELAPWLDRLPIADAVSVPGADAPLSLTDPDGGVAVTTSGMGKAPAATTVAALHCADGLDVSSAHWVSAGIAGAAPQRAALGSAFVADAILDWDRKHRWDPDEVGGGRDATAPGAADGPDAPAVERLAYLPEGSIHHPNPVLVDDARDAADDVELVDREDVRDYQARYPDAPSRGPRVGVGTTVTSDEFWHGSAVAREVDELCDAYDVDPYATTQMEDAATAAALSRFGALERHVSVRAVANYDRPAPGEGVHDSFEGTPASVAQAVENAARVGRSVVETLLDRER
ncbi:phosphorylase [Halovivax sp.]|uniref:phosphorylase family protein n=1 Tax=Halovivax sp. TaxID=1935978 RepID=UPI0025B96F24|nr:phosphorylase [Halovivax sp.]